MYIYILHTSKLICITIHLWIFPGKENVLTLLQYDMQGGVNRLSYLVGAEICEMLTVVVIAVVFFWGGYI